MLMVDPAADIDQPRSTSIDGPKVKIDREADVEKAPDQSGHDHRDDRVAIGPCRGRGGGHRIVAAADSRGEQDDAEARSTAATAR